MAKTTAPLLSFGARGTIAKTAVYATWRGRSYVRRHVIPANPKTAEQTKTRSLFAWLNSIWKAYPTLSISPWDRFATGQAFLGRNAHIGQNISAMRDEIDIEDMIFSPGAKGGLGPLTFSPVGGVGVITCTFTQPAIPSGWTLQAAVACAIEAQNPQTASLFITVAAEEVSTPWLVVALTVPAGTYWCGGWTRWAKPDGSIAYGPSLAAAATAT